MKCLFAIFSDRFLPDKAIDLIDEASSKVQLAGYEKPEKLLAGAGAGESFKEKEEAIRSSDIQKAREVQDRQAEAEKKLARLQARYDKKCEAGQLR